MINKTIPDSTDIDVLLKNAAIPDFYNYDGKYDQVVGGHRHFIPEMFFYLRIQIICTFNAPLTRIDKALLRKGRVIASYEFKPLTIKKSNTLLKSLNSEYITTKEMTLAEVFYQKDLDFFEERQKCNWI